MHCILYLLCIFVFVLCICICIEHLYLYAVESFGKFGCSLLTTTHAINALFRHHNQLASVMPTLNKDFSLAHCVLNVMQNAVHITYYMDSTTLMVWSLALVILLRQSPGQSLSQALPWGHLSGVD